MSREDLVRFAVDHCPIDPTFGPFVAWCRSLGVDVELVSDGFGFYIEHLLRAAGIEGVGVVTNTWSDAASISSCVTGGSKLNSVLMFLHMKVPLRA